MLPSSRALCCGFLGIAVVTLTGCGIGGQTAEQEVAKTFAVTKAPRVVVEMFNGGIEVIAGVDDRQVSARVTKRGSGATDEEAKADLANVEVALTQDGDKVYVLARRKEGAVQRGGSGASAVVEVPTGSVLELQTTNGDLSVVGVTGDVTGKTTNGGVKVKGSKGALNVTSSNGAITVEGGTGKLDLTTSNGGIKIRSDKNALVNVRTSNGSVEFDGALADGEHMLHSSNGGITVTLPADAHFRLDASTSNGKVTCDFPLQPGGDVGKKHLRGTVGDGQATSLELHTSNASIHVRRGQ